MLHALKLMLALSSTLSHGQMLWLFLWIAHIFMGWDVLATSFIILLNRGTTGGYFKDECCHNCEVYRYQYLRLQVLQMPVSFASALEVPTPVAVVV